MINATIEQITTPALKLVEVDGRGASPESPVFGYLYLAGNVLCRSKTRSRLDGSFSLEFTINRRLKPRCEEDQCSFGVVFVDGIGSPIV